ncbi:MAG: sel1 repeat family protein [Sideroxydans sp.]|nr:sel1 repeat family protein [Sideroxydans sp.]
MNYYRLLTAMLFACLALPAFAGLKEANQAMEKEDYPTALKEWKALAAKGDAEAQFQLGVMYGSGMGVESNIDTAVQWYSKAAKQNHAKAAHVMSIAYRGGQGVKKDEAASLEWLKKAAELGAPRAQNTLGDRYFDGDGVAKDFAQALAWYQKAANQNDALGQRNIAYCHANGAGVPKDEVKAEEWYLKAVAQNQRDAQYELGVLYMGQKKFKEGVQLLNKAAKAGHLDAHVDMALAFALGDGVDQNLERAYLILLMSEDIGQSDRANELKDKIGNMLSEDQKARAKQDAILNGMSR